MKLATNEARVRNVQNLPMLVTIIVAFVVGYCTSLLSVGKHVSTFSEEGGMVDKLATDFNQDRCETIPFSSAFNQVYREVYYNSNNILLDENGLHSSRKRFNLSNWKGATGGGLQDTDRLLLGNTYYEAFSVFEFGLGESTQIAASVGVPRYSGIDSDAIWVMEARNKACKPHFKFSFADIGETGAWGVPLNDKVPKIPLTYQFQALHVEIEPFDVYLVDGRYRVACVMASFLHALSRKADMHKIRVLIHDATRDAYQTVLQIADIVDQSDLLYVLRLKEDTTEDQIADIWRKHMSIQGR